jgi:putative membrane protein
VLAATIVVGAAFALLVLPPATLTSATATQRSINSSGSTLDQNAPAFAGGDTSQFTVKDWAMLLRQGPDADFLADKTVDVTGFVTASPDDPENVFYVARFVVTCCAVDAQPVGVPVYLPRWAEQFAADQWVEASGVFAPNPGSPSTEALLLTPDELSVVEQPDQPYVF